MNLYYTKIKIGNWLYKHFYPLYKLAYFNFKTNNDKEELEWLESVVQPGFHVLDIGANIGFYGIFLSKMVGENGMVYCFEPNKKNYNNLISNVRNLNNVKTFNLAISDKKEILKLYTSKLLNVDHRSYPVNNYDTIEEIDANSIENLIENGSVSSIDLIKIDIQGFEIFAFRGMKKILQTKNVKIVAEFWPHGFKKAGYSAVELFDFFKELNYDFKLIGKNNSEFITRQYIINNNEQPYDFSFNVVIEKNSIK